MTSDDNKLDNLREISFRIDSVSKSILNDKATKLGITLSSLIRTIIEHDNALLMTHWIDNGETKLDIRYNAKISFIISKERYDYLNNIAAKLKVKISVIMREIIDNDCTEIMERSYIDNCVMQLYPFGILVNNIAHQLNSDNIKAIVSLQSYQVAHSRLGIAKRLSDNILSLLKFMPENPTIKDKVILTNKNDIRIWIGQLYPITNNIHQISKRLYSDFTSNIINQQMFEHVFNRLKLINENVKYFLSALDFIAKI